MIVPAACWRMGIVDLHTPASDHSVCCGKACACVVAVVVVVRGLCSSGG